MDARTFLGLEGTNDPLRFRLPVRRELLTPGMFLFGGCGLGAGVEALEQASGRPVVWASAQYLSYATMPATLDLQVDLSVHGRATTQARCVITDPGGDGGPREILTVNAALGTRPSEDEGSWAERPDVPGPEACKQRRSFEMVRGTVMDVYEIRQATGVAWGPEAAATPDPPAGPEAGRSALWIRLPGGPRMTSSADLAIVGDHVPSGLSSALSGMVGGNSLDNSLRIARNAVTEWVLVDIRIHAVHSGFGHGLAHLWAEDGTLLGTASQSVIVRRFTPEAFRRHASD